MNRKDIEKIRRENLNKLDTTFRPKINAVEVNINNSIEHELAKFICVWSLRIGFPASQLQYVITGQFEGKTIFLPIILLGQKFKHEWERPQVVTEARFKKTRWDVGNKYYPDLDKAGNLKIGTIQRRADIFILDTGEIVEIETNPKIEKEGDNVITVNI